MAQVDEDTPDFRGMTYAVISARWGAPISQITHFRHVAKIQRSANSAGAFRAAEDKNCRLEQSHRPWLQPDRYDPTKPHRAEAKAARRARYLRLVSDIMVPRAPEFWRRAPLR
jgi:hypothetical protein